jgi:hypothetical protein
MARGLGASIDRTPSGAHFSTIRSGSCGSDITGPLTEAPCAVYRETERNKECLAWQPYNMQSEKRQGRNGEINYLVVVDTLT